MKKFFKLLIFTFLGQSQGAKLLHFLQSKKMHEGHSSFSQEGEDRVLANIFRGKKSGFYVDVGAHHPFYLSNTHLFYRNNWRGINIDANPDCMQAFKIHRPLDININTGVGTHEGEMCFYNFEEPALSSFDERLSLEREANGRKISSRLKIKIKPLRELLREYLPPDTRIDFMSIDVEGLDLDVLKSNDWKIYRPHYLLVECIDLNLEQITQNPTYLYLKDQGYSFSSKLINTCFFVDSRN